MHLPSSLWRLIRGQQISSTRGRCLEIVHYDCGRRNLVVWPRRRYQPPSAPRRGQPLPAVNTYSWTQNIRILSKCFLSPLTKRKASMSTSWFSSPLRLPLLVDSSVCLRRHPINSLKLVSSNVQSIHHTVIFKILRSMEAYSIRFGIVKDNPW